jgi:hypothetical protein
MSDKIRLNVENFTEQTIYQHLQLAFSSDIC